MAMQDLIKQFMTREKLRNRDASNDQMIKDIDNHGNREVKLIKPDKTKPTFKRNACLTQKRVLKSKRKYGVYDKRNIDPEQGIVDERAKIKKIQEMNKFLDSLENQN